MRFTYSIIVSILHKKNSKKKDRSIYKFAIIFKLMTKKPLSPKKTKMPSISKLQKFLQLLKLQKCLQLPLEHVFNKKSSSSSHPNSSKNTSFYSTKHIQNSTKHNKKSSSTSHPNSSKNTLFYSTKHIQNSTKHTCKIQVKRHSKFKHAITSITKHMYSLLNKIIHNIQVLVASRSSSKHI